MFEYFFVYTLVKDENWGDNLIEKMNELGRDEWEAVSIQIINYRMIVLMKRRIPYQFEMSPEALEAMLNASMGR